MKNRTVIGLICIAAALLITFGLGPLTNKVTENRAEVVRVKDFVPEGSLIYLEDLEKVTVGTFNIAPGVLTDVNEIAGKYAASDLHKGDYIFADKLKESGNTAEDVFTALDGRKQAVSISVSSYAAGVSGKLENGDIITLFVYSGGEVTTPPELRYLRVITTTAASGLDKDEQEDREQPVTITLLATRRQAELLTLYENSGKLSSSLVFRGSAEDSDRFIAEQDRYLLACDGKEEVTEHE